MLSQDPSLLCCPICSQTFSLQAENKGPALGHTGKPARMRGWEAKGRAVSSSTSVAVDVCHPGSGDNQI